MKLMLACSSRRRRSKQLKEDGEGRGVQYPKELKNVPMAAFSTKISIPAWRISTSAVIDAPTCTKAHTLECRKERCGIQSYYSVLKLCLLLNKLTFRMLLAALLSSRMKDTEGPWTTNLSGTRSRKSRHACMYVIP